MNLSGVYAIFATTRIAEPLRFGPLLAGCCRSGRIGRPAFPEQPVRQWVLSFPYPLRFLFASRSGVMGQVLGIVYRVIATHLIKKAGFSLRVGMAAKARQRAKLEPARGARASEENVPLFPEAQHLDAGRLPIPT